MHRITNAVFADYFTTLVSLGMLDFLSCLLGANSLKLTALTLITVPARTLSSTRRTVAIVITIGH